uniref:Uncharacterized protein n=1 Tax=Setaria italica TaxID=4555 RepID=K3XTX2_SETIT
MTTLLQKFLPKIMTRSLSGKIVRKYYESVIYICLDPFEMTSCRKRNFPEAKIHSWIVELLVGSLPARRP